MLPCREDALEATEGAFRAGTAGFSDLVDAQRTWLEFELSYQRALADRGKALARLEMLVGREAPFGTSEP